MTNLMQMMFNRMTNNPQIQSNPMAKKAMQMYQNGDTQGLQSMAENLCKEKGISVDDIKNQIMNMFNH